MCGSKPFTGVRQPTAASPRPVVTTGTSSSSSCDEAAIGLRALAGVDRRLAFLQQLVGRRVRVAAG